MTERDIQQAPDRAATRLAEGGFRLLVGGKLLEAEGRQAMPTFDPSTGEEIAAVPLASPSDVAAAVDAATTAKQAWDALGIQGRRPYLAELGRIVADHVDELAMLDAINSGNRFQAMVDDVSRSVYQFTAWPAIALMEGGKTVPVNPRNLHFTEHRPYGVVGRIAAYNHPALFALKSMVTPLVMGNTVVVKPADQTPLSALRIGELFADVLPPGVLNVVSGNAVTGDALVTEPRVKRIGFTGSVATGMRIQARAASVGVKHVSLELGGKNAMVVFPDAPIGEVARAALRGMNLDVCQGQSCGSTSRIFAHAAIHDELVEAIRAELAVVRVGRAYDPDTTMGPLITAHHRDRVATYVDGALGEGARLVHGGNAALPDVGGGYYIQPTLLDRVEQHMTVANEEIFGPVISVLSWTDETRMLADANAVDYGLTGSVWTDDLHRALRVSRALDVGYVWVNEVSTHYWGMPFGGTKNSGVGREESIEELESYAEVKAVNVITRS